MSGAVLADRDNSYRKQLVYARYAQGAIPLAAVPEEISKIVPNSPFSIVRSVGLLAFGLVLALLVPSWTTKKDR